MQDLHAGPAELVRNLVHGRWKAQALIVAVRLKVPDHLAGGPLELTDLARELDADEDALGRLMRLLSAMGIFEQDSSGRYANNDASRCLFDSGQPGSLRLDALQTLSPSTCIAWDNLEYSIRHGTSGFEHATGKSVFQYLEDRPEEADITYAFQAEATKWNVASLLAAGALPESGTIVDVGGGNGTTLLAILESRENLSGVLYDLPLAIDRARKRIADVPAGSRIELVEGDFFRSVPEGGDFYLISHVLHDWPDNRAVEILRHTREAMGPDATVLITEVMKPEDGGGWLAAYLDLLMLVGLGGRERTAAEYGDLLRQAGFTATRAQEMGQGGFGLALITAQRS